MDYLTVILILIFVALIPWLIYFVYYSKLEGDLVKIFVIGGVGWVIAFFARLPILSVSSFYIEPIYYAVLASILAGVFEEACRFIFIKKYAYENATNGKICGFGVGWGLFEVVMIHTLSMTALLMVIMMGIEIPDVEIPPPDTLLIQGLAGSYERLIVVPLHIGLTLLVFKAMENKTYLFFAIFYHALVNLSAVLSYTLLSFNMWLVEALITILVIILYVLIYLKLGIDLKDFFSNPESTLQQQEPTVF